MEKVLENSLLFDFYGELLTDKQKEIFKLYTQEDLSLAEIGAELGITRQAIHDSIKHTKGILEQYEMKLGLVVRYLKHKNELEEVVKLLDNYDTKNIEIVKAKILRMIED